MSLTLSRMSAAVFVRGLHVLDSLLSKAEAHAGDGAEALIQARLAPDMLPLAGQVQRASDTSKLCIERLTGVASPRMEDNEASFAELHARVAKTVAYIESVEAARIDSVAGTTISVKIGGTPRTVLAETYLASFALPNFFFHLTTAYDILRHSGVPIGKLDYLGSFDGMGEG